MHAADRDAERSCGDDSILLGAQLPVDALG
jgi:hypothetical protein